MTHLSSLSFVVIKLHEQPRSEILAKWITTAPFSQLGFQAIDKRDTPKSEIDSLQGWQTKLIYGRTLTPGEVGAAQSHFDAYKVGLKSGTEWLLIMEDDCSPRSELTEFLNIISKIHVKEPILINLNPGRVLRSKPKMNKINQELSGLKQIYPIASFANLANCYLLNRSALEVVKGFPTSPIVATADFPPFIASLNNWLALPNSLATVDENIESVIGDRKSIGMLLRFVRWVLRITSIQYFLCRSQYRSLGSFYRYEIQSRIDIFTSSN